MRTNALIIPGVILLILMVMVLPVMAQTSSSTGTGEKIVVDKSLLTEDQIRMAQVSQTIETVSKWRGMGEEVGDAVDGALTAVTTHATEFADTDLGTYVMVLVAWRVIGKDFLQILFGVPYFFIGLVVMIWSFNRNAVTKRLLVHVSKDGEKKWEVVPGNTDSQLTHWGIFVAHTIITCLIIFA